MKGALSNNFLCSFYSIQSSNCRQRELNWIFSYLSSNFALTLGYINPASNNRPWTLLWAVTSPRDPALSQTSRGQRSKREYPRTRLIDRRFSAEMSTSVFFNHVFMQLNFGGPKNYRKLSFVVIPGCWYYSRGAKLRENYTETQIRDIMYNDPSYIQQRFSKDRCDLVHIIFKL